MKARKDGRVPASPELQKALEEHHALFKKTFGRDPNPTDPVIWDPDVTTRPVPLAVERSERAFDTFCEIAGRLGMIPPQILFAMKKTRLFITDQNIGTHAPEDIVAWKAALAEYQEAHP